MDIESKYVSEDYAKEYINILLEANRLRKNGDLKVRNWFKRFPVWLTYSAIVMTGMILWYGYEAFYHFWYKVKLDQTNLILIFAVSAVFIILFFITIRELRTYLSMLQTKKIFLQKDRNVVYHIDENGMVYEDIGTKIVNCSWFDTDFVIVQKHGCYIVPRDMTSLGVIGVPNSENGSLEDYLLDQNIPVTILRK